MAQIPPPPSGSPRDWTTETADRIEAVVTAVREKTTVPVQKIAAAVVYGLVAGVLAIVALILLVIGLLRLHVYLWFHPEGRRVWVTYVVLGAIFTAAGMFCWRKRSAPSRSQT
jgi:hypothetical protein